LALKVALKPVARLRSPHPQTVLRNLVPPHRLAGRPTDLGCNGQSKSQSSRFVKLPMNTAFFDEKTLPMAICD
jgi:hypothetical protein